MDEPKVLPPAKYRATDYFAEAAELAQLPASELQELLSAQIDALAVKTNHAALKVLKCLEDKTISANERTMLMKELIGYGMFNDSVNRQRVAIGKSAPTLPTNGQDGRPTVEIPKSLSNEDWEAKYADKFLDKTATKLN